MGVETMVIATAVTAAAGGGAQIYEGRKVRKAQKRATQEQEDIQREEKAEALRTRKKQIDKMRRDVLAPQIRGGRRSLMSGSEQGVQPLTQTLG